MTFKHIFSTGYLAEIEINEACNFDEAASDLVVKFYNLREQADNDKFTNNELDDWFCHILEWCGKTL